MPYRINAGSREHKLYRLAGFGLIAILMILLPLLLPEFQVGRLNRAIAMAVATLGLNLVVGYSGLLALCQSAFIAIGAFTTASLIMDHRWDYWMAIPVAMLFAFIVGLMLGVPALKIKGVYLALATVAFAATFPGLTKLDLWGISDRTGGANGRDIVEKMLPPDWAQSLGFSETSASRWQYFPIAILGIIAFWAVSNLVKSRPGRAVIAIRDNETGAAVSGVNLRRFKVVNFGLSAALGGLAGCMWAMNSGFVAEQDFTFVLMVDLLVALVLGGVATISGSALGALLVVFGRWVAQTYVNVSLSALIWMALVVVGAVRLARRQQATTMKVAAFIGTLVVGWGAGAALFAAIDIPGLYQLDGDGPLSQAIFGFALIVVVLFAPQGLIGAIRQLRSKIVQIVPTPPAIPDGVEVLVSDVEGLTRQIEAAKR